MDRLRELFFLPPLAVARLGGSDVPLECFVWDADREIHGAHRTVIRPAVTLDVKADGTLQPYLPSVIRFRDGERLRPVAPFFELWATVQSDRDGSESCEPVTLGLLDRLGASPRSVQYTMTVGNRKAERRTGSAACAFIASTSVNGADHERRPLLAWSPHNPDEQPLVHPARPIPLGHFQVIRPVPTIALGVDLSILRVRFTPARGLVYGPPGATAGPASPLPPGGALAEQTLGGRLHEIVPPENRILNPDTAWSRYVMDQTGQQDPQPSDSYDGANVGDNRSWGVVDDTCDGIVQAELVVGGQRFVAAARVLSSCPDFAPDRRPFYSFADDLADRDLPPVVVTDDTIEQVEAEVADLFARVFETVSLVNLDATRFHGIDENLGNPPLENFPGLPQIDQRSMTKEDRPFADLVPQLLTSDAPTQDSDSVPSDRLPYASVAHAAHAPLADVETLLDFLRSRRAHVERLLRPPFGRFHELGSDPGPVPNARFRDPRVHRDTQQDMRMPPYMRDSDETPMSLTWRQYHMLLALLARLAERKQVRPRGGGAARTESPLARRVVRLVERVRPARRRA